LLLSAKHLFVGARTVWDARKLPGLPPLPRPAVVCHPGADERTEERDRDDREVVGHRVLTAELVADLIERHEATPDVLFTAVVPDPPGGPAPAHALLAHGAVTQISLCLDSEVAKV